MSVTGIYTKRIVSFIVFINFCISAMTAEEIINKVEEIESVPHSFSRAKEIITTTSGKTREFEIRGHSLNGNEKQLQIYDKPARVRGEKILMLNDGDDIWAYSPKTKRVRHLATHMKKAKVMGSDFSYQDFAAGDYQKHFNVKLLGEEKKKNVACYKLELIPTPEGPTYKKEIIWVGKKDYVVRQCDFYDENRLRLDIDVSFGKHVAFSGDLIFKKYFGAIEYPFKDFLPEHIGQFFPEDRSFTFSDTIYLDNAALTLQRKRTLFTIGIQQLPWGSGYAWNPTDIWNKKELLDPIL